MKKVLKFWACPTCPLRYLTHDMLNNTDIELCFNCVIFYCNSWWILILHLFCSSLSWSLAGLLKSMNNCSQVYTDLVFSFVFILSFNNFSYVRLILSVLWSWWEYWNETIITWVTFSSFLCCSSFNITTNHHINGWCITISFGNLLSAFHCVVCSVITVKHWYMSEWVSEVAPSCPTLCDSVDCSPPPGSSLHGILQARILEWIAISFSRWSSWPRDFKPRSASL